MSRGSEKTAMLEEVQRHIVALEESIHAISTARKHLKQNSMEVKCDIQTTVTHQLEALRERELYLLRQVDLVQQVKDAALQGQEHQLHTALGGLNHLLQWREPQANADSLTRETIDRLKSLEMRPRQTPNISFKADLPRLNQTISNFGSVDSRGLSVDTLFDADLASQSIPRPFEDYEDEEHHVLYKSVGESNSLTGAKQVSVGIPRLSKMPQDWLFMPSDSLQPVQSQPRFQFPPFSTSSLVDALDKHGAMHRSVSSTASIHQWLCDLQGQDEGEEAEYELVSPHQPESTKGSSIEILSMDGTQAYSIMPSLTASLNNLTLTPDTIMTHIQDATHIPDTTHIPDVAFTYFQEVLSAPTTRWLLGSPQESSASYCSEILRYFRDISNDTKHWLMQYTEKQQVEDSVEAFGSATPCFSHQSSIDIEDLEQLHCVTDPVSTYFREMTSDPQRWLLGNKDEDKDEDDMEIVESVRAVCKANEPCQTFQDCVSDEKCCSVLNVKAKNKAMDTEVEIGEFCFAYFDCIAKQKSNGWLLSDAPRVPPIENHCPFPPFSAPECNTWLLGSAKSSSSPITNTQSEFVNFIKNKQSDSAQWLHSHGVPTSMSSGMGDLVSGWESLFRHHSPKVAWPENSSPPPETSGKSSPVSSAPFPGFHNNLPLQQWLLPANLTLGDEAPAEPSQFATSWLFTSTNFCQGERKSDRVCIEEWLAPGRKEGGLKELGKQAAGKQCELPECMDDSVSDIASMTNQELFTCFLNKGVDNKCWLAEPDIQHILID